MKNSENRGMSRRSFLQGALGGATALGIGPTLLFPKPAAAFAGGESPHPHISALRVVGVEDPKMTRELIPKCHWSLQGELVADQVVAERLDLLALALSGEKQARDAWQAIFLKPPTKSWSEVRVGIKANGIGRHYVRTAVLGGICRVLIEHLGVKAGNIAIYDGVHGDKLARVLPEGRLPPGCRVVGKWDGITLPVVIPGPWKDGRSKSNCLRNLGAGEVDILVNTALCKGHARRFGGFTMTMKNHLGTFEPRWAHSLGSSDYLFAINKTAEILGSLCPDSGRVLFPRQQLCLVDALWASEGGPDADASCQPNRLFMGVFAPVLDYQVASRFRAEVMNWEVDMGMLPRFLTEYGFRKEDLPNGGKIIDALGAA